MAEEEWDENQDPSGEHTRFSLTISLDRDSYFRRACPSCGLEFKTESAPADFAWALELQLRRVSDEVGVDPAAVVGESPKETLRCPYCQHLAESSEMQTAETVAFLRRFALHNSLERRIGSEGPDYVMRRIRENYITGSSCTIVLVGRYTWGRKYVDWEIKATVEREHGLISVQLPTLPITPQNTVIVPDRLNDNIQSGYALWVTWHQITSGVQSCTQFIEQADARDKRLIDNSRERRLRNG